MKRQVGSYVDRFVAKRQREACRLRRPLRVSGEALAPPRRPRGDSDPASAPARPRRPFGATDAPRSGVRGRRRRRRKCRRGTPTVRSGRGSLRGRGANDTRRRGGLPRTPASVQTAVRYAAGMATPRNQAGLPLPGCLCQHCWPSDGISSVRQRGAGTGAPTDADADNVEAASGTGPAGTGRQ
jgi:hypothetical protein